MAPSLRKRKQIDLDEHSEGSSGSDSEDNASGDENVEPRTRLTAKKTDRARKATGTSTAKAPRRAAAPEPQDVSMQEVVLNHSSSIPSVIKTWVQGYEHDRTRAVAELLSFFVQACGCEYSVTEEEVEEGEVDKLMQRVLRLASENGIEDYVHAAKGKGGGRLFQAHFQEAWDRVVREAATSEVLFDGFVLSKVLDLVMAVSCATVRSFRLVATIAAMQLVTSLIRVISTLMDARDTAQRQLEAEQKRKGNKAAAERTSALRRTIDQAHHRATELKDHIKVVFEAVAAHRFRDISEEVRSVVIVGIGNWIELLPSMFLQDAYLKYLAWALSDKDAPVRQAAVTALLRLYLEEDNVSPLHAFTARFSTRFAELVYDVDEGVAVKGIQLMTRLAKLDEVEGTAVRDAYRLLVDDAGPIRHAAADLVADLLEELGSRQLQPSTKGKRRKSAASAQPSQKELQLSGLLYIMYLLANNEEDDDEAPERRRLSADGQRAPEKPLETEMVDHVVDALFDRVDLLTDWKTLTAALEGDDDGGRGTGPLNAAALTNLLQVLRASVHKACGGTLVVTRQDARKGHGKAQKAAFEERRRAATLLFMKSLPGLLHKYQTDPVQACSDNHLAAALAGIAADLQLEVFSLRKAEPALEGLLRQLADTLGKHVARPTLDACVHALLHATVDGSDATKDHARLVLESTADTIAKRLSASVDAVQSSSDSQLVCSLEDGSAGSDPSQDDGDAASVAFAAAAALQRADRLQLKSGALAPSETFLDAITRILQAAADGRELGRDIIGGAARNAFTLLLWRMHGLDAGDPDAVDLASLADAQRRLTALLETTLEVAQQDGVREAVFYVLGDMYMVFGAPTLSGGALSPLHAPPSEAALRRLWTQCEEILDQQVPAAATESQEEEAERGEAQEALEEQQEQAIMAVGRLAVHGAAGRHRPWLAAQLLSHYVAHGKRVETAVKDVARQLKKVDAAALPDSYAAALRVAFERTARYNAPEEDFTALADRIAASYAGFNASAAACDAICRAGAAFALRNAPRNLEFLAGLKHFVSKLPAERAEALAAELEAAAAPQAPDDSADEWQPFYVTLDLLRERAAKGKTPRGALKKNGAKGTVGKSTAGASARRSGRRISFAAADEEDDDEGSEAAEEVREEDIRPRQRRRRVQDEVEDSIEEDKEDLRAASESPSALPAASPAASPASPADDASPADAGGDGGYEEGDDGIMPTEEELPRSAAKRPAKKSPKRKRTMRTLYAASDEEKSGDDDKADSDDSLLHADEVDGEEADDTAAAKPSPPKRRAARSPKQRTAAAAPEEESEEEEEEVPDTQVDPPPRPGFGRRRGR